MPLKLFKIPVSKLLVKGGGNQNSRQTIGNKGTQKNYTRNSLGCLLCDANRFMILYLLIFLFVSLTSYE